MGCNQSKDKEDGFDQPHAPRQERNRDDFVEEEAPVAVDESNVAAAGQSSGKYKGSGPMDSNGAPIGEGDAEFSPVFQQGLLWRIVQGDVSSYYNDTQQYEMNVTWKFGPTSTIVGCTPDTKVERDADDWIVATLTIYPNETKKFVQGEPNGYKSSASTKPLSEEYRARVNKAFSDKVAGELEKVQNLQGADEPATLETCVKQKVRYVDLSFPPQDSSLSRPGIDRRSLPSQAWKRPIDFLRPEDHDKIRCIKKAEPGDIDQGQLGDCWFLCAVASLAEFPDKVKDMFRHPKQDGSYRKLEEKLGAYHVTFNKNGWWKVSIVDDYFPCVGDRPCYAKCVEDPSELWVNLLEKAYAKAHGSYASIAGGDALLALQDLTGYPIHRFDEDWEAALKKQDASAELFDNLLSYDQENYLINVNTPGTDNSAYNGALKAGNSKDFEAKYKEAGLGMGHAYSVLTVKDFPDFPSGHLRLMQIRNPWGNGTEWTGAWGDNSSLWEEHPEVAEGCNFTKADDGSFWMEWRDVQQYFDGGGVCFMKNNWFDYRVAGAFVGGFPNCVLEIRCTKKVTAYVVLSQKDKRGLPQDDPNSSYSATLVSVSKAMEGDATRQEIHLSSGNSADKPTPKNSYSYGRDRALEYTFEPSEEPYIVVPRLYKNDGGDIKDYVLGLICDTPIDSDFTVSFKTLNKDSKVFASYSRFDYNEEEATEFATDFQYNPELGCPVTSNGSSIVVNDE